MEDIQLTTLQKAEQRAEELTAVYKDKGVYKIHPIVFKDESTGDEIVGFIKEPSRAAKMAVMDKSMMGAFGAVEEILDSVLLKDVSDPRMFSEDQAYDAIHMGLVMAVYKLIEFKTNTAKKK